MKNNNSKYIFLRLKEKNGEYEYYHRSAIALPDNKTKTAEKLAEKFAEEFYCSDAEAEDGGYYFHGGAVFVKVDTWQFISEEHFQTLTQYL